MSQTLSYVDVPSTTYTLRTNPLSQNTSKMGLGLSYHAPRGLSATLGYNISTGSGSAVQRNLGLNLNIPFDR